MVVIVSLACMLFAKAIRPACQKCGGGHASRRKMCGFVE